MYENYTERVALIKNGKNCKSLTCMGILILRTLHFAF